MLKKYLRYCCGMAHGLGYGDNFQSVLMSNGIREMKNSSRKYTK
jgi:glycerol-3-phosphate dehydrogenase (NAD(P)+)